VAPSKTQTFHDHIVELRRRLLWVVVAVGLSTTVGYLIRKHLITILQRPLGAPLYYNTPAGSFNFIFKLAFLVGFFITLPVVIYQLLRFIEPALPNKITRKLILKIISSSYILALAGIGFGYFYMIPMSLHFFAQYSSSQIRPLISANEYLSYIMGILITFALAFQIPLLVLFINRIKPIKPRRLLHYQRHVIVGSLVFALILPFTYDPISQFIVAIPIVIMYYLSIVVVAVANRRHRRPKVTSPPILLQPAPKLVNPTLNVAKPVASVAVIPQRPPRVRRSIDGILPSYSA
jgi:sec-independent protein translocase protein TatC